MATIRPTYKVLMAYNIRAEVMETYYYYVLKEFVPELESMGLYMYRVWQVTYGDYPMRQIEFVSEDLETVQEIFSSERWQEMEARLKSYTTDYTRKLVPFRSGFQF
jgi:hypothetical protein